MRVGRTTQRFSINSLACTGRRSMTPLFEAIISCAWTDVLLFLQTGQWETNTYYVDCTLSPTGQAQKWIFYRGTRQLALHTAITYRAPLPIIRLLIQQYPKSIEHPDSRGNLPLHLAFMTNARDVSSFLLKMYPQALMEINKDGILPVECYSYIAPTETEFSFSDEHQDEREELLQLLQLEQRIAKDHYQMTTAETRLLDLKHSLHQINQYGQRQLMAAAPNSNTVNL